MMESQQYFNNKPPNPTEESKDYLVQNMPNWNAFLFVLAAPLCIFVFVGFLMVIDQPVISFIVGAGACVGIMIFLFRYLQQKIAVTVAPDFIRINYVRKPFYDSTRNLELTYDDIESYKFDDFNGARFVLYLKNGRRFRAAMGSVGNTAAIREMAEHIIALIENRQHSLTNAGTGVAPRRRKTYAEGTTGLVLAIIMIILMIAMGIAIVFFQENHKTSDTVRGIGVMFTCLAFVLHVFNLRRKAKKGNEVDAAGS